MKRQKKTAYRKDIMRTILNGKKRFISILVIVALGVIMSSGLRASCVDLRLSADLFMDEQNLYDIMVQSTLGLTDDDVAALEALESISQAEGGYTATVNLSDDTHESVLIKTICPNGMNEPYLTEGSLPEAADEIAVSESYLAASGKSIGDTLTIEEIEDDDEDEDEDDSDSEDEDEDEDESTFYYTEFVITAVVQDAADINNPDSTTAFRDTSTTDYTFFVSEAAVNSDIYTAVYLTVAGAAGLNCYSDEYEALIAQVVDTIEDEIMSDREEARTQEILEEASDEIDDAEDEMNEAFEEADEEIADAESELADARQELDDGWAQYYDGLAEIEEAQEELEEGIKTLQEEEEAAYAQIEEAWDEIEENQAALEASWAELEENETTVSESLAQVEAALEQLSQIPEGNDEAVDAQRAELEENLAVLEAYQAELAAARTQLEQAQAELEAGIAELEQQEAAADEEFAAAWQEIEDAQAEIDSAKAELADALAELEQGEEEYAEGLAEFEESVQDYEEEKADAEEEIAEARADLADIDTATWYVQDRTSLAGFSNVESDSGAIEAIGNYFPIIFLAVAVLISLTTITRMVDEERNLIGTYKALGFTNGEIRRKYIIYSLAACLAGSIIGELGGFLGLPAFVFIIFRVMYKLPVYHFSFDWIYGLFGPVIFFIGVGFSTWYACRRALHQRPAVLMRPKAPRAGSRVFLEKITFIWRRLSFLNKVTARNLFRYKKRLTMTIVGIAGCTGLLLFGFAIKDSVADFVVRQYGDIYQYELMAVASDNDELLEYMDNEEDIESYLSVRIDSVTVEYDDSKLSTQIIVVPDEYADEFGTYISLYNTDSESISLETGQVLITRNVSQMLGFSKGDTVSLQDLTLAKGETEVSALVQNYLGNNVYMTAETYEEIFGQDYEANGVLAFFTEDVSDAAAWAEEFSYNDGISSAVATQQLEDEFDSAFILLTMVVYIIIVMAALLAFVVLFTLSTTNISEREREIATIKVLGFHDKEVHLYVNKEMMILTVFGMIPGLVLGYFLSRGMTPILKMPGLYFAVSIHPVSYVLSLILTLVFAILVQFITNRVLNKVDPVEALKSIE